MKATTDLAQVAAEAVQQRRANSSLQINKTAARKKLVNPYLAHKSSSSDNSSFSSSSTASNPLLIDHRIGADKTVRRYQSFKFVKAGALVKRAEYEARKAKQAAKRLDQGGKVAAVHNVEDELGVAEASSSSSFSSSSDQAAPAITVPPIPRALLADAARAKRAGCEWWDLPYLEESKRKAAKDILRERNSSKSKTVDSKHGEADTNETAAVICSAADFDVTRSKTWKLIHKPEEMDPVGEALDPGPQPIRLTEKERKKIRRRRRQEKQQEEQDKIRLGIMPAPAPRVKISNMMRVLGDEAVMDPSKLEKRIKSEAKARKADHDARNLAAKLTPAEAREKKTRKLKGDREAAEKSGIHVAVFKVVGELRDATKRFKIDMNARQLYLTGVCLIVNYPKGDNADEDPLSAGVAAPVNMVVVEGGRKGVHAYKKLMLRRIKWDKDHGKHLEVRQQLEDEAAMAPEEEEEGGRGDGDGKANGAGDGDEDDDKSPPLQYSRWPMSCTLVWEGMAASAQFEHFRLEECNSARVAKAYTKKRGCEHMWDMME